MHVYGDFVAEGDASQPLEVSAGEYLDREGYSGAFLEHLSHREPHSIHTNPSWPLFTLTRLSFGLSFLLDPKNGP
jgi:hypothetical protein